MRQKRLPGVALFGTVITMLLALTPAQARNPIQMTPQQAADWKQSGLLAQAAKSAMNARDYADAVTDFRRATKLEPGIIWLWVELGRVLDYQGKRDEAFRNYQKGFGFPIGSTFGTNDPQMAEAVARFGTMCEDKKRHTDAIQCFNKAQEWRYSSDMNALDLTLDAKDTSPTLVRMMLLLVQGGALEEEQSFGKDRKGDAMVAFRAASRLAPRDPRPVYFVAYGLRRAGRFTEAEAALRKASALDTAGSLKAAISKSLEYVHERWRN